MPANVWTPGTLSVQPFRACQMFSWKSVVRICQPHRVEVRHRPENEFRNVVGELEVVLNREFQMIVGVRFSIRGRRVVFSTGHLQVPFAVDGLQRVVPQFIK